MEQYLQVFVTVAEKQNFSRAAEEMHMTQPAVSQYIQTLESNTGARLLERTNKYVRLTKAGSIVYYHAKEVLGLYTNMQNLVDDLVNKANGPLSIGASYTFGEYVLPWIVANLLERYPAIQPEVTIGNTAEISKLVATHQIDVGIVEGHFDEPSLQTETFAEDEMAVVASPDHALSGKKRIDIQELKNETWIVREKGSGTREANEKLFQQFAFTPARLINFGSTQPIKEAVGAGLGVSMLSQWAIQKEIRNRDLMIINIEGLPFYRRFSVVTNSPFQTKAQEVFISLLRDNKVLKPFRKEE